MGKKRNEIRDCRFEQDTGFRNFTKRDSGNVDLWNRDPGSPVTKQGPKLRPAGPEATNFWRRVHSRN